MVIFQSLKNIFQRPNFPGNSAERAIFAKFQAPKFENSEPEKLQFHTPSHSIPPLDSLLCTAVLIRQVVGLGVSETLPKCLELLPAPALDQKLVAHDLHCLSAIPSVLTLVA